MHPHEPPPLFRATIRPHRSLSPRGLRLLIAALCGASLVITTGFALVGAWPVLGFAGAEIALAVTLLGINARRARRVETVTLTEDMVEIERCDEAGRRTRRRLRAAWLSVVLEERLARVPGLFLRNRTEQEELGREIGEQEKRVLADGLAGALHRLRNPVFDNPQLRPSPEAHLSRQ